MSPTISSTRARCDDPALVHHHDVGAGLLHLGEQVAGDQHRPAVGGVALQHPPHLGDLWRVKPIRRLVEHEQLGQAEHGLCDREPLLHAVAVFLDPPADRVTEPGDLHRLVEPRVGVAAGPIARQ